MLTKIFNLLNMENIFKGYGPARQEAEMLSKKEKTTIYVVKADIGGIAYVVTDKPDNVQGGHILDEFQDGAIVL